MDKDSGPGRCQKPEETEWTVCGDWLDLGTDAGEISLGADAELGILMWLPNCLN